VLLGLVPRLLLLSRAEEPADSRLLLLLVPDVEALSSKIGSGHDVLGTCLMRQIRAVSGTLLTGSISLAKKALIRVDLPTGR
jgi:hypothetical protein